MDLSEITGAEYTAMSEAEQLKVLTEVYRQLCFDNITTVSLRAIDVLESMGINDYESGSSRIELPLGFLRTSAQLIKQCFVEQHRHELQVMSAETEFAAALSESIYDRAAQLQDLIEDLVTLQTYYSACLMHRKESNVHLIDEDGTTVPYSKESIERERLKAEEQDEYWKQNIREQRAELERV